MCFSGPTHCATLIETVEHGHRGSIAYQPELYHARKPVIQQVCICMKFNKRSPRSHPRLKVVQQEFDP